LLISLSIDWFLFR